jgi:IMP dehydrogenase
MYMDGKFGRTGFTFDDVLLVPDRSSVLPGSVSTSSRVTRSIPVNVPLVSAAMDSVTEARMAISMAREGAVGVIHRNMSIDGQAVEVDKVKRSESGMIVDPITLVPNDSLIDAVEVMAKYHISGVPITENGTLVGILTNRDIRFQEDFSQEICTVMTKDNLVTVPVGTTLDEAKEILRRHKIEKLPVVDEEFRLRGLITVKDIQKKIRYPLATKDDRGRLRVAAATGVGKDGFERARELVSAGVDILVIDTAHGHSMGVIELIRRVKSALEVQVIAGNVTTADATVELIENGADAVKVGVGAATICTTRVVAGAGVPQLTAIYECAQAAAPYGVPIVADGGVSYSGDIAKAVGAGADCVMLGGLLAGTDESPGEIMFHQGERFKEHRGMGSQGAMKARGFSRDRYGQEDVVLVDKLVPEGIEGRVAYKGPLNNVIYQLVGGLRAGMGYVGAASISEMKDKARFVQVTGAGVRESHPHDIVITKEAPNYSPQ